MRRIDSERTIDRKRSDESFELVVSDVHRPGDSTLLWRSVEHASPICLGFDTRITAPDFRRAWRLSRGILFRLLSIGGGARSRDQMLWSRHLARGHSYGQLWAGDRW